MKIIMLTTSLVVAIGLAACGGGSSSDGGGGAGVAAAAGCYSVPLGGGMSIDWPGGSGPATAEIFSDSSCEVPDFIFVQALGGSSTLVLAADADEASALCPDEESSGVTPIDTDPAIEGGSFFGCSQLQ